MVSPILIKMENSFFKLNKTSFLRIVAVSLILSASIIIAVVNFAMADGVEPIGSSVLACTCAYIFIWCLFFAVCAIKRQKALVIFCRTWCVLGMSCCVFNAVATLASLSLSGAVAYAASFYVALFAAPMYGLFFFGDSTVGVMIASFCIYLLLAFVPELSFRIYKRHKIRTQLNR